MRHLWPRPHSILASAPTSASLFPGLVSIPNNWTKTVDTNADDDIETVVFMTTLYSGSHLEYFKFPTGARVA